MAKTLHERLREITREAAKDGSNAQIFVIAKFQNGDETDELFAAACSAPFMAYATAIAQRFLEQALDQKMASPHSVETQDGTTVRSPYDIGAQE